MAGSDAKDRMIYPLEKRVVNPIVLLAWDLDLPPPGDALLETTGRRTGRPWSLRATTSAAPVRAIPSWEALRAALTLVGGGAVMT